VRGGTSACVRGAADTAAAAVQDMCVDHGRADVLMAEEGVGGLARATARTAVAMAFWMTVSCRW
jgi:hypothetical protein